MFKFDKKITVQTNNNGTEDVEIMVPLKYQSNFWRALEMSLIHYKISLILTFKNCSLNCNLEIVL